jgi:DNA-binding XRE family transcriptional regulator
MKLDMWMASRGLTDDDVASLVKVDRTTISRLRRGLTKPSWELAAKLKGASKGAVIADDFFSGSVA